MLSFCGLDLSRHVRRPDGPAGQAPPSTARLRRHPSRWHSADAPACSRGLGRRDGQDAREHLAAVKKATRPALTPQDELKTFSLPPGYHAQLVAAEPLIESPIIIDFDPDGRMWVLELQAFLPDTSGRDTQDPICDVAVLEDTNGDGAMDKRTVFADHLVLPRALKVLDHGVLVGEPPNLWLMKDTNGDLKADTKERSTRTTAGSSAASSTTRTACSGPWTTSSTRRSGTKTCD